MPRMFTLTPVPIQLSGLGSTVTVRQPLWESLDVSGFDVLDVEASLIGVGAPSSMGSVDLLTGNHRQTDEGWLKLTSTASTTLLPIPTSSLPLYNIATFQFGLAKYIRYSVTLPGGVPATDMWLFIRGVARSYSR